MKNLSKLAVCSAVLFGVCGANGMFYISSTSFNTPAVQQVEAQEKNVENKVETNSAEVQGQAEDQKDASVEPTKDTSAENE